VWQIRVETPCPRYVPNPSARAKKCGPRRNECSCIEDHKSRFVDHPQPPTRAALGDHSIVDDKIPSSRYSIQENKLSAKAKSHLCLDMKRNACIIVAARGRDPSKSRYPITTHASVRYKIRSCSPYLLTESAGG
jgi:hypothetical protein